MDCSHQISVNHICKRLCILLLALFLCKNDIQSQPAKDYALNANIIYRITKYIEWPVVSGDFVIGVVGKSPMHEELEILISGKKVHNQKIVLCQFKASAAFFNCHLLFICENERYHFEKIVAQTMHSPILLITESDGLASEGSCINFVTIDNHLKLEINKKNIESRDLKIATELLQLGIVEN